MMTSFSQTRRGAGSAAVPAFELARRSPQRITATLPWRLHCQLRDRADIEGRSLSNLVAHLLEAGIKSTGLPGKI
jgi:hypothetical protein